MSPNVQVPGGFYRVLMASMCLLSVSLFAVPTVEASTGSESAETSLQWNLKGGISLFLNSQSKTPSHLFKPAVRFELQVINQWPVRLGTELVAVVAAEEYRLLGGYLTVEAALHEGTVFRFALVGGPGLGTSPPILYSDLRSDSPLGVWGQFGMRAHWTLMSERLWTGVELLSENVTTIALSAMIGARF